MAFYKVSCNCGNHIFPALIDARFHAEYEMKESTYPHERWSYTIYRSYDGTAFKPIEKIKRVRQIEKVI